MCISTLSSFQKTQSSVRATAIDYEVKSWDAPCYIRSQNFVERYQLFYCLKTIKEHFNQDSYYCTPQWFVTKYKEVFRDEDAKKRIIFDRSEVDFASSFADGTAKEPRFLRHWASADIRGRIAEQAEWLLANQIATASSSVQLFNIKIWVAWCERVQEERVKASKAGERWGIPPRYELRDLDFEAKDKFGFERFGGTAALWQDKLSNALNRKHALNRKQKQKNVPVVREQIPSVLYSPRSQWHSAGGRGGDGCRPSRAATQRLH